MKKGTQLPKNILSPVEDLDDDEDEDDFTNYKISPIDDEESHIYAKITRPAPYMIQRFQQQPFPSNPSISSLESNDSQNLSSLDSANTFNNKNASNVNASVPTPLATQAKKKPFVIKNLYVKPEREEKMANQIKFTQRNEYIGDSDDEDDQYVTLLPVQKSMPL